MSTERDEMRARLRVHWGYGPSNESGILDFAASEVDRYRASLAGEQSPELAEAERWLREAPSETVEETIAALAIAAELDRLRAANRALTEERDRLRALLARIGEELTNEKTGAGESVIRIAEILDEAAALAPKTTEET